MDELPEALSIYHEARLVGTLSVAEGVYRLEYEERWRQDGMALSVRLPLTQPVHEGEIVRYFFDNLLPEERVRAKVARRYQVSDTNIYGLLCYIGRECAGAFSLVPRGENPPSPEARQYRLLTMEDLSAAVEEISTVPFLTEESGVSMSLAGAQEKLPLLRRGRYYYLPLNGAPSNLILKPDIEGIASSALNEYYCLQLAKSVGLEVVSSTILMPGGKTVLCVDRYDRCGRGKNIRRLHQEDFCQLLGLPHDRKYEKEGGPGFAQCAELIRRFSSFPTEDLLRLCGWGVFNACIGNADAHGKNLALLYREEGAALAPFYDIVSTAFYGKRFDPSAAMHLGGARIPREMTRETWAAFAADLDLPTPWVLAFVEKICHRILEKMTPVADSLIERQLPKRIVNDLLLTVAARTREISGNLHL